MNKIEEILEDNLKDVNNNGFYGTTGLYWKQEYAIYDAMKEFGKICFEAGRKGMVYSPEETGDYCWIYEDFLKEIEDETGN